MEGIIKKLIRNIEHLPGAFQEWDVQEELSHLLSKDKIIFCEQPTINNIKPDFLIKDRKGKPLHAIELKVRQKGGPRSNPVDFLSECGSYHGGRDNILQCKRNLGITQGTVLYIYKMNKSEDSKIPALKQAKNKICNPKKYSFIKMYYLEFVKKNRKYTFFKGLVIHRGKIKSQRV